MKMLFVFCAGSKLEEVRTLIDVHEVHGYTEIHEASGSGDTGKHFGTRAWPGTSAILITAARDDKAVELVEALTTFAETCSPEEGIRVFQVPAERVV